MTKLIALGMVVGLGAGCGQSQSEGLTFDQASQTSYHATYIVGHTSLVVSGELRGSVATARIAYRDGTVITEMAVPTDYYGGQADQMQLAMERSAAAATTVIGQFANDQDRVTEMTLAYQAIDTGLDGVLEPTSALRSAAMFQATVLTTAILDLAPDSLIGNPAIDAEHHAGQSYMANYSCPGCAPNDNTADRDAAPTWTIYFDSNGNPVGGGGALQYYPDGSGCEGACGVGCDWCLRGAAGGWQCWTNSFCQWHDAHCGSWWHFFSCS